MSLDTVSSIDSMQCPASANTWKPNYEIMLAHLDDSLGMVEP